MKPEPAATASTPESGPLSLSVFFVFTSLRPFARTVSFSCLPPSGLVQYSYRTRRHPRTDTMRRPPPPTLPPARLLSRFKGREDGETRWTPVGPLHAADQSSSPQMFKLRAKHSSPLATDVRGHKKTAFCPWTCFIFFPLQISMHLSVFQSFVFSLFTWLHDSGAYLTTFPLLHNSGFQDLHNQASQLSKYQQQQQQQQRHKLTYTKDWIPCCT